MSRRFACVITTALLFTSGCSLMRPAAPHAMTAETPENSAATADPSSEDRPTEKSTANSLTFADAGVFGFFFWMLAGCPD